MNDVRPRRRWWRSWRVWLIGAPALIVIGLAAVLVWGYFQPRPEGFAPTDPDEGAFVTDAWTRYTVDATSSDEWVFFDFEKGRVVETTFSADDWDLAFQRTDILTNSGATNPSGPGGAVDLGEVPLEVATVPESVSFEVDRLDGDDPENPAIGGWYTYEFFRHIVHANDNTYLVRTGGSRDALVHFDSYYCDNEDSGCVTFRYRLMATDG